MAGTTIGFGAVLIAIGLFFFAGTGFHAPTSLIPTFVGLLLLVSGLLARGEDVRRRMLWMHIAVTVGLLAFIAGLGRSLKPAIAMLQGQTVLRPLATEEGITMALVCLAFVLICVRSFIAARRTRTA